LPDRAPAVLEDALALVLGLGLAVGAGLGPTVLAPLPVIP
jgi:hypothetical protein